MPTLDPPSRRKFVEERAGNRCEYCRIPEEEFIAATVFHEEHIIPKVNFQKADPEMNAVSNLAWACPRCNGNKLTKTEVNDPMTDKPTSLFNPRLDIWKDHFAAYPSGHIAGLTSKGRATAEALAFNDGKRVLNRLSLYLRGLWPG